MNIEKHDPDNPDWSTLSPRGMWVVQTYNRRIELFKARIQSQDFEPWLREYLEYEIHWRTDKERIGIVNTQLMKLKEEADEEDT